jgi:hypothetical protein
MGSKSLITSRRLIRSGGVAPPFLTSALDGGVVSFTPLPLYPWGKSTRHLFYRTVDEPQNRSGRYGENCLFPTGNRTPTPRPFSVYPSRYTELSRLPANPWWGNLKIEKWALALIHNIFTAHPLFARNAIAVHFLIGNILIQYYTAGGVQVLKMMSWLRVEEVCTICMSPVSPVNCAWKVSHWSWGARINRNFSWETCLWFYSVYNIEATASLNVKCTINIYVY